MDIKTGAYKKEGVYLYFANGDFLDLAFHECRRNSR